MLPIPHTFFFSGLALTNIPQHFDIYLRFVFHNNSIHLYRGVVWRSMSRTSPQQGSTEQNICECLTTQLNITYPGFVFHNNSIHLCRGVVWRSMSRTSPQQGPT